MNIEKEFLKIHSDSFEAFPDERDYVGIYKTLKEKFDREIHPEIKTKILEIEKDGYYNDHGVDHIKMVIDRASKLLNNLTPLSTKEKEVFFISPYEIFILLMSINLHDTGHLIGSRKEHASKGKQLLSKFDSGDLLSRSEKLIIGKIAQAHSGKNDPIGQLEAEMYVSHKSIRPQLLAAILRLADELAEDKTRASKFLLDIDQMIPSSEIFHRYSESLDSLNINHEEIKIEFYIEQQLTQKKFPKFAKDQFLIDEIYERTLKTFTESLYCNRFLPERGRLTTVKVKIHFFDKENNDDVIDPISYTIKESGYPSFPFEDIYKLCPDLVNNKVHMDGKFFLEKIGSIVKPKEYEESI
ncbi:hypothetical protein ACFOET_19845 [Parapedobacter deserti]|uniref:HD-CE domain-containing protein n=1 Tax=Parapedobacter deserti TaxID=1912957 RepID=A0ABV7JRY4_9SPHI